MSTPTIFFVAPAGEALTMGLPIDFGNTPRVDSKNITPDIVGDLDFALTGERYREPVCLRQENEFVVYKLDDELVAALVDLTDEDMAEVADEWGIYDLNDAMEFLDELRELAREAQSRGEDMFLYW
jgi:hypothetical protein